MFSFHVFNCQETRVIYSILLKEKRKKKKNYKQILNFITYQEVQIIL